MNCKIIDCLHLNSGSDINKCTTTSSYCSVETVSDTDLDMSYGSSEVYPVQKIRQISANDTNDTDDEKSNIIHSSEEWIWKPKNNRPKIWKYTEIPGLKLTATNQLNENSEKLDFFYAIFDKTFWEVAVNETNRYADQCIRDESKKRKIDETWVNVNSDELKVYFALCIIMAEVRKPKIQMNWSRRAILETPIFRKSMSHNRFLQITRYLQISNNDVTDGNDQENKIKPLVKFFNKKFKEVYTVEENIAIQEHLVKFNRRLPDKNPNASKRARFSIKFYKLCELGSGYCHHFKICTGSDKINFENNEFENFVMGLTNSVLHKGHTLYLDNCYSSPELFLRLTENQTNAVGIVGLNRKNMPPEFTIKKLKRGKCEVRSCNGILALKWKDVRVLSTRHGTVEMCEGKQPDILEPKCIIDFNKGIAAFDNQDQIFTCFPIMRKHMKGYRKILFYIFDMALYNTNILYKKVQREKKCYADYRIDVAEALLKTAKSIKFRQVPITDSLERLRGRHFPKHIDPTQSKQKPSRTCKVCSKHKKRSETTWECKQCRVALHVPNCFEKYHTLKDF